jgi:ketosteroid isomerase-like protein
MVKGIDIVKAFYAAAASGDTEGMVRQLAADVQWTEMQGSPYGGTYRGAPAILQGVFARLGSEWENFAFNADRFHDAGDSVVASGWYTGAYRATGKPLRCRTLHVWDVRDGRIVAFEQFCDTGIMGLVL